MAVISSIHANVIALNTFQKNLLKWPQEKWPPSPTSQENVINDQPPKSAPLCHGVDYFWLITTISALLLIKGLLKKPPPPAPSPNIQAKQHQTVAYYSCLMALKTLTRFPLLSRSFLWREVFSGEGRKLISWTAAGNQAYHKTYYNYFRLKPLLMAAMAWSSVHTSYWPFYIDSVNFHNREAMPKHIYAYSMPKNLHWFLRSKRAKNLTVTKLGIAEDQKIQWNKID